MSRTRVRTADRLLVALLVLAAAGVVALTVRTLSELEDGLVPAYLAPLYWLDYRAGFVRRGLPGELLSLASGGPPSYGAVVGTAIGLTIAGGVAVIALAWRLVRLADGTVARVAVGVLVVASPFVMLVLPGSVGRYDAVGVVAAAVVALLPLAGRLPAWPVVVVLALVVAAACASEEFLGAYLIPVAVAAAVRLSRGRRGPAIAMGVVVLAPGALIAALSLLSRPDRRLIGETGQLARAAGVPGVGRINAVTALGNTLRDQLALFDDFDPGALIGLLVIFGLLFGALAVTLWLLVGRPVPRTALAAGVWSAVVALAVTVVGVDVGRWWGLAFVGFAAFLAVVPRRETAPVGPAVRIGAVVLALVCVPAALLPAVPALSAAAGPPRAAAGAETASSSHTT
jgi:hypothetical protein